MERSISKKRRINRVNVKTSWIENGSINRNWRQMTFASSSEIDRISTTI